VLQTEPATTGDDSSPARPPTGRRWPADRVFAALVAAGIFVATLIGSVALIANVTERERYSPQTTPVPSATDAYCEGVVILYGIHGTDCRSMPVVTAPGALGPPNTGGPGGGTDWKPAFPGSNVWIPEEQISGRLVVHLPGSGVPPPEGYEKIGQTPDGAILYWQPHDHPDAEPTVEQGRRCRSSKRR
jgi:hypothetical protein